MDIAAVAVYSILLPVHCFFTLQSLKHDAMRNFYHVLISTAILMTILVRLGCLIWSLVKKQSNDFDQYTLEDYLYF